MATQELSAKEILENYRRAGEISKGAKALAKKITKPGANAFDIAQKLEAYIRSKGAKPSFPVNFSINNEAAHYSPEILDSRTVGNNDMIKVDLGAHVDGYIVDTAITINFNKEYEDLAAISKIALDKVIDMVKPGVKVSEVGTLVEQIITEAGYQPIRNLSGHSIKRYNLHSGVSIPNHGPGYMNIGDAKFKAGNVYAIEPFASNGVGEIKNAKKINIFQVVKKPKKREDAKILSKYMDKVGILPFSPRFVYNGSEDKQTIIKNIKKLVRAGIVIGYHVLIEIDPKAIVSQHEHTILVTKTGCEVFT